MSSKRPVKNYQKSAIANARLIPSQRKYKRRKTFNRWEKAAITRAENKLRKHGGQRIVPLTKQQYKALDNKEIVIGDGIRGVKLEQTTKDAKASIKNGQLRVKSDKREYHYISLIPDIDEFLATGKNLFAKGAKEVWTWTVQGRAKSGWPSFNDMLNHPTLSLPQRWDQYKYLFQAEQWMLGLVAIYGR